VAPFSTREKTGHGGRLLFACFPRIERGERPHPFPHKKEASAKLTLDVLCSAQVPGPRIPYDTKLGMSGRLLFASPDALVSARILSPIKRGQRNADPLVHLCL